MKLKLPIILFHKSKAVCSKEGFKYPKIQEEKKKKEMFMYHISTYCLPLSL